MPLTADELKEVLRELKALMEQPRTTAGKLAMVLCLRRLTDALDDESNDVPVEAFLELNADGRRLALAGLMALLTLENLNLGDR